MNELRAKDYAVAAQPQAVSPGPDGVGASTNVLLVVWRRKWIIVLVMLACIALALFWVKLVTPAYTAMSTVKLEIYQNDIVDIEAVVGGVSGDSREIRSQLQVIRSRSLMGRVVDVLNLTQDPEFNPDVIPDEEPSTFSLGGVLRLIFGAPDTPPEVPTAEQVRDRAIDMLTARTNVLPVHYSFVFSVAVQSTSRQKAALLANTIAEQYTLNQIETKYQATEQATAWLSNRVSELKLELEAAEEAVGAHLADNEFLADEAIAGVAQRLLSMQATQEEIIANRDQNQEILGELTRLLGAGDLVAAAALSGSIRLENLAATIMGNGGPEAEATARATQRFTLEMKAVTDRLTREITQASSNLTSLDRQIDEMEAKQADQGSAMVRLAQLEREAQAAGLIYETFLNRLKETSVQQGVHKADAVIISEARVPTIRSFPSLRSAIGAALMLGFVLSAMIVAILEMLDQTFATPDELETYSGLPILGMVPKAPLTARSNVLKYMLDRPSSAFVESVRNLRTSVQLSGVDGDVKVVALASAGSGEGKTMLSVALAMSSATQRNCRVLLMDCDLRRRRLTTELGGRGQVGLISYFAGKASLEDIIQPHDAAEFDIIYADRSPKITADIFASQKFAGLVTKLRNQYDIIIIDTPPVLALTDVRVIAGHVDLLLFSVSWKRTKRRLVRAALNILTQNRSRRVALVMNRTNIGKSIGYYDGYYYQ